jgi:hypothetical protein
MVELLTQALLPLIWRVVSAVGFGVVAFYGIAVVLGAPVFSYVQPH